MVLTRDFRLPGSLPDLRWAWDRCDNQVGHLVNLTVRWCRFCPGEALEGSLVRRTMYS